MYTHIWGAGADRATALRANDLMRFIQAAGVEPGYKDKYWNV